MLVLLVLLPGWSIAHPLHLSITNITYENGMLKISMKTFKDDWETAYFHFHSKPIDFADPALRKIEWLADYLNERFKIAIKKDSPVFPLIMDSVNLDGENLIIEMHFALASKPNSLYFYNALLTDIFADQTNLVIFGFEKKETGIKFDVYKHDTNVLLK